LEKAAILSAMKISGSMTSLVMVAVFEVG